MSDEKLSEGLEKELQILVMKLTFWASGDVATQRQLANLVRPLLARLERERDAARTETWKQAIGIAEDCTIGEIVRDEKFRITETLKVAAAHDIALALSVVSQPSCEDR